MRATSGAPPAPDDDGLLSIHNLIQNAGQVLTHVPDEVHSTLKARAVREGMSLSDLINGPIADSLRGDLAARDDTFIAPHLLDIEALSAIRGLVAGQRIDSYRREQLLLELAALPAERYAHTPLLGRIWELRHIFTAYDAAYIALAEATNSVLYTCDEKLCRGHRARTTLFAH